MKSKSAAAITQYNQLFINIDSGDTDDVWNIHRTIGTYVGHDLIGGYDSGIHVNNNVLLFSSGSSKYTAGVQIAETDGTIDHNHAVMTGGKAKNFWGVVQSYNDYDFVIDSEGNDIVVGADEAADQKSIKIDIKNNRTTVTGGETTDLVGVQRLAAKHMSVTGDTTENFLEIYGDANITWAYGVISNVAGKYNDNVVYVDSVGKEGGSIGTLIGLRFAGQPSEVGNIYVSGNIVKVLNSNAVQVELVDNQSNYNGNFFLEDNKLEITDSEVNRVFGYIGHDVVMKEIINNQIDVQDSKVSELVLIRDLGKDNSSRQITSNFINLIGNSEITEKLTFVESESSRIYNNGLTAQGTHTIGQISGKYDTMILTVGEENNAETGSSIVTLNNGDLDLSDVKVTVDSPDGLNTDENYKLIHTADGTIHVDQGTEFTTNGTLFTKTKFTFTEDFDKNTLTTDDLYGENSVVDPIVTPTDNSKTLSDSILGSVAVINQGASFVAGEGMQVMESASLVKPKAVFGTVGGGKIRYDTGSRVDVDSMSLVTGVVTRVRPEWMVAGFIEAGFGNSESNASDASAEGNHDYYGIGAATRYRFDVPFYVDGSLRFGTASTEFSGRYADNSAHYDADSLYGSAHVGMGYVFDLSKALSLDVYGRYIFTYLEGDTVSLGTVDHEKLVSDDTLTHTMQVGAMLRGKTAENIDWHFGLAYEHVADGDAESTVFTRTDHVSLNVPTLEGDSGIVDMGITIRSTPTDPMALDLGVKAYAGDVQGIMGSATLSYAF